MATIVSKYNDYTFNSVEYMIDAINNELSYADLPGLTNNHVEFINVSKQHPLVSFMEKVVNDRDRNIDYNYSSIIPAISVTPLGSKDERFTLGKSPSFYGVKENDDFIKQLKTYQGMSQRDIQKDVLLTHYQIETILDAYRRTVGDSPEKRMYYQRHKWMKREELNVSVWSDTPDVDILLGNLVDSVMASIQGYLTDNSRVSDFSYNITKGLTNFNYGRVLYGSEYVLTFLNTYSNYIIYTDNTINRNPSFIGTYTTQGDDEYYTPGE